MKQSVREKEKKQQKHSNKYLQKLGQQVRENAKSDRIEWLMDEKSKKKKHCLRNDLFLVSIFKHSLLGVGNH